MKTCLLFPIFFQLKLSDKTDKMAENDLNCVVVYGLYWHKFILQSLHLEYEDLAQT